MATTYTTDAALGYPAAGDRNYHTPVNATVVALDGVNAIGDLAVTLPAAERPTSTTLNVRVAAGNYRKADGTIGTYAGTATQLLTASATNYLYLTDGGTLTANTSGWPAANVVRLATVVTGTSTVTTITDQRVAWGSGGVALSGSYLALAGGTLDDGANIAVGTTTGTKIGIATTQKLGFFNATPVAQQANTSDLKDAFCGLGFMVNGGASPLNLDGGALTCGAANVNGTLTMADAQNIALNTTTGTKIGTATTQKLAFYNATPIAQQANTTDLKDAFCNLGFMVNGGASPLNLDGGALTCGAANITGTITVSDAQNVVLNTTTGTKLGTATTQKLGFWNATPVIQPAAANQAAVTITTTSITDSTTGTADGTLADVGGAFSQATLNNNFADLAAKVNSAVTDLNALRTLVNQLRSDLVAAGLIKGSA